MTAEPLVLISRKGSVASLTLNRPKAGNALNLDLMRALTAAAAEVADDAAVRCVILRGAGRCFCVGGDVVSFAEAGSQVSGLVTELASTMHESMLQLLRMDKPLITAINGPTAGGGIGLSVIGDIVLAGRSAQFTLAYSGIGMTPDGGATWLLPRLVGLRRAQELLMTGRRLNGEEAVQIGLATRLVEDAALEAEADTLAQQLARGPTVALGRTRRLLLEGFGATLDDHLAAEVVEIARSAAAPEGREGVAAFVEKRPPLFT